MNQGKLVARQLFIRAMAVDGDDHAGTAQAIDRITDPAPSTLWGLGRVIAVEQHELWGGLIDLDPASTAREAAAQLYEELIDPQSDQLTFRGGRRYVLSPDGHSHRNLFLQQRTASQHAGVSGAWHGVGPDESQGIAPAQFFQGQERIRRANVPALRVAGFSENVDRPGVDQPRAGWCLL